jgi:FrmR/RcnR family transcriptional regulator, repressor of frmRAB operon
MSRLAARAPSDVLFAARGRAGRLRPSREQCVSHLKGLVGESGRAAPHSVREKQKLLNRVKRIQGQLSAVADVIQEDAGCERALHVLAASRGAIHALMAEILEDHIRYHVLAPQSDPGSHEHEAAEQLVDIVKSYLR